MWFKNFRDQSLLKYMNTESHESAAILFDGAIVTAVACFFYAGLSFTIRFFPGMITTALGGLIFSLFPILFIKRFSIQTIGIMYIFFGFLVDISCIIFSGGFQSPVLPWMATVPLAALLLINVKWANIFLCASMIFVIILGVLEYQNIHLPKYYNEAHYIPFAITCYLGLILIVLTLSMIFEREKQKAYLNLDNSRNKVVEINALIKRQSEELTLQKKNLELNNELLDTRNEKIEILLKEIHHRVKNNLQTISSLLYLQSSHIQEPHIKEAVKAGQSRVESMALIHQKLYQREDLGSIEMKDYLQTLGNSLVETYSHMDKEIELVVDMDEIEMDIDKAVPMGLIANELITNSLKYAFSNTKKGIISVHAKVVSDQIKFRISDNGIGKISLNGSDSGFGSQLVSLLTKQLNGTLENGSENGYWTSITLDMSK